MRNHTDQDDLGWKGDSVTTRKAFGLRLGKLACTETRQQVSRDRIQEPGVLRLQGSIGIYDHEGPI